MQIRENTAQTLVLSETSWWVPGVGVIVGAFCFWSAATQMDEYPAINRLLTLLAGLLFIALTTLAMRRIRIHFDRSAGSITRTTEPLLPLGNIHLFRARSESRPIQPIRFAYLERQLKSSSQTPEANRPVFCLALATGVIPQEVLSAQSAFISIPEMDKVRWLVGYNAGMKLNDAQKVLDTVNQWLGTSAPALKSSQ
ncbi:MAG: hypothetical protein H8E21_01915 [Gammaproteobacteria bacterium]|nr:hypothetical protein [Gammaproteobacteria bacterium]MBL7000578.1 hypothetical protein [Gammaproteobacteria bacterium]